MKPVKGWSRSGAWLFALLAATFSVGCSQGHDAESADPAIAPKAAVVSPRSNANMVPINTRVVVASFTKEMDAATVNGDSFKLIDSEGANVAGVVRYDVNSKMASLTPASPLETDTPYTATISTDVTDKAGNALESPLSWRFTTSKVADTTAPTVSTIAPAADATEVPVNTLISVSFSEPMDPLSLTTSSFFVVCSANVSKTNPGFDGDVFYAPNGDMAVFKPARDLPTDSVCKVTVTSDVEDTAGNALMSPYSWSFSTGATTDSTEPTVISTAPAANATEVPLNTLVSVSFSEPMDPLSITTSSFYVLCSSIVAKTNPGFDGDVFYAPNGNMAVFKPARDFPANSHCVVTVTTDVSDASGVSLANNFVWTFTTSSAIVPPTDTPPNDNPPADGPPTDNPPTDTPPVDSPPTDTPPADNPPVDSPPTDNPPTDNPPADGPPTDDPPTDNPPVDGPPTDDIAPTVSSTAPAPGATGVAINTLITAAFSEPINALTVTTATFTLAGPDATAIPGTVSYASSSNTASFTAAGPLLSGTTYTGTLTTGIEDSAGNALANDFVWTFTTSVAPDTTAPIVTSTTPASDADGVAINTQITATFSEPMTVSTINTTSFTLACPTATAVTGTVAYAANSNTATFTPSGNLPADTTCTGTISTGAKDAAGNPLSTPYTWSFSTGAAPDTTAPTVVSTNPTNSAGGVCPDQTLSVVFSEPMDPLTISTATFTLSVTGGASIAGVVSYDTQTSIATFSPTADLSGTTTDYTATIKGGAGGVMDLATPANSMADDFSWSFTTGAATGNCLQPVALQSAAQFGLFGGSAGMTNSGLQTVINADIGTTAASTSVTGFHDGGAECTYTETPLNQGTVNGTIYTAPPSPTAGCPSEGTGETFAIAQQARADAQEAYDNLVAKPAGVDPGAGNLGGLVLTPGVYTAGGGSFKIEGGDLTLDAQGDPNAVWIFQMASSLTVGGPGAAFPQSVLLVNGAQSKNVFWQVGSFATINAAGGGTMVGTIISQSGAAFSTAGNTTIATLNGRILSLGASVTLVDTVINVPAP